MKSASQGIKEKSWERRRIPIYGMQRMYLRVDEFRKAPAGQTGDKPETAQPGALDLRGV